MSDEIVIELRGDPVANALRAGVSKKGYTFVYRTGACAQYYAALRDAASDTMKQLGRQPLPNKTPIECLMLMVLPIPDSWSQRKKEAAARGEILPTVTPDISNMLKLAEDALKHVVWSDDKDIVNGIQRKIYGWAPLIKIVVRKARPLAELRRLEDIRARDSNLVGQDEETVGPLFVEGNAA